MTDRQLISEFLEQRCNAAEAARVHLYLQQHPEVLQQLYQKDWDDAETGDALSAEAAALILQRIESQIRNKRSVAALIKPLAAAAAAVLLVAGIWSLLHKPGPATLAAGVQQQAHPAVRANMAVSWEEHRNPTTVTRKLLLPDGTTVLLSPAAMIRYQSGFSSNRRDIILKGNAQFDVAKDRSRPFTVIAGNISTTALGTSFRVRNSNDTVLVQLLTGKVVVRPLTESAAARVKDVYLLPGQQLQYIISGGLVKLPGSVLKKPAVPQSATIHQHTDQEMVFSNTPLEEVFRKLRSHHNKPISYSAEDLSELSFTGTIFYKDSLPLILQAIARMNGLEMLTDQQGYIIRKQKE